MEMGRVPIVMIGPVEARGGIASVMRTMAAEEELTSRCSIDLIHTSDGRAAGLARQGGLIIKGLWRLSRLASDCPSLVVHIHASYGASFYRKSLFFWAAKMLRRRVIWHIHSSRFEFYCSNGNPFTRFMIGRVLTRSDLVVVLAHEWERLLLESFPRLQSDRVKVVRNPISLEDLTGRTGRQNGRRKQVLYIGLLLESKGLSDLIRAAPMVLERMPETQFIICGDGPAAAGLKNLIQELGLQKSVSLVGWVEGSAKTAWLTSADVFVLPSYKEGMPVALLEAMACGLPVVSTRVAAIPEIIDEGRQGFLIEPGDVGDLGAKIARLLVDDALRDEMGRNARDLVGEFATGRIADQWIDVYQEVAAGTDYLLGDGVHVGR
jgi:glycosyltransferase involved in cell wall biosynthesis